MISIWRDNWKHLRLPFQMTLAPIFLWGYFLARDRPDWRLVPAFIAFHFLLYTGITAFNSFYDRDQGPIGGLERPPELHRSLLPLSLALQAIGLILAIWVGSTFAAIYVVFMALSVLYSHPRFRWKANPWLSAAVVCGGQGGLGFLAGWAAARGEIGSALRVSGVLGALSAALTTLGMYPLTQVYQLEEDARRGDRTLCVVFGPDRALRIGQAAFVLAGTAAVILVARRYTIFDATILALAYLALFWSIRRFRETYVTLNCRDAFWAVLRLSYASSAAFALFIVLRIARW